MADSDFYPVIDLFSGAGGMSYGFHAHEKFKVIAAADAEIGKPSMGAGSLQCNATYQANMGFSPTQIDLAAVQPENLRRALGLSEEQKISVLSVCPPCTGFSRANPENHVRDDPRNSLVRKAGDFARVINPEIVVMENARELVRGNFREHFEQLRATLEQAGYQVSAKVYLLTRFGLPQIRERAIVIAAKAPIILKTFDDLWANFEIIEDFVTTKCAFESIPLHAPNREDFPKISDPRVLKRLKAIPENGGSWVDLLGETNHEELMTPAMKRLVAKGKLGSHPDVYGRLSWSKPAPTIKRECAHIGNGRYAHPVEDRLCSVREMASLQGFPADFRFGETSLSNKYRHIGDAVPPLISHQLAHLCDWMLSGCSKTPQETFLPGTHLTGSSVESVSQFELLSYA